MFRRFDRIPACDRETDRRTDGQTDILRQRYVASRGKISARPLTLLIFAIGWAVCGRPQPGHESMMTPVLFSLLCV